jgi:CheY-like chemotaxis protein
MDTDKSVLVVDDDAALRELLEMMLEDEGYRPLMATNGQEALNVLQEERPALVLLDLMMPVMDGWQFLEQVRRRAELKTLPIILLSAVRDLRETEQRYNGDCNIKSAVAKPFNLKQLILEVEAALAA